MKSRLITIFYFILLWNTCFAQQKVDLLVIGGGASGTTAGIQAARMGLKTLITEETLWLGGMLTSAGVSAIDGNYKLQGGLFGEFCDSLKTYYGSEKALQTGWVSNIMFEPSIGNKILNKMTNRERKLSIWYKTKFISAKKTNDGWVVTLKKDKNKLYIFTKLLIDATELGDVAKFCGVKYDIGMEEQSICNEKIAPEKPNNIIQDLTYVMILKDYQKDVTIPRPENYNPSLFYCSTKSAKCTNPKSGQKQWDAKKMIEYGKLPNSKYMINWPIEGNDFYVNSIEMTDKERETAYNRAKQFSLCYLYYLQTELGFSNLGLVDDEFPTKDKFPMIPYHRESRRIHGLVRFNVNDITAPYTQKDALYRTGVAVGDYPIDHHHKRYWGSQELPNLHFFPIPSYSLPLGTMIPQNIEGLIVAEKSISVSNIVNGSTRLQPVVMQIGQSAGILAALAIKQHRKISEVSVRDVQKELLNNNGYLLPYLDLPKNDIHFKVLQRIGVTGILKGEGKNIGWHNETWFNADSTITGKEIEQGLTEFDSRINYVGSTSILTINDAISCINLLSHFYNKKSPTRLEIQQDWAKSGLESLDLGRNITRKEFAVLLDLYIDPFNLQKVDIRGKFISNKSIKK